MQVSLVQAVAAGGAAAAAVTLGLLLPVPGASAISNSKDPLTVVGLTADQRLVTFSEGNPGQVTTIGAIRGLRADSGLVGIDYRVHDGGLYGVGDRGGVYTLSTLGATATKVSQLTVPLAGTSFGVDFNPATDRLRIISDNGQNLLHNLKAEERTVTGRPLTVPPAKGPATGVTGAAYTNNDSVGATGTTLLDVDTVRNQLALQSPADSGQLATTGQSGVDPTGPAGFDIYTRGPGANRGFAALTVGGTARLYDVELVTGGFRDRGAFPTASQVTDIALPLDQKR